MAEETRPERVDASVGTDGGLDPAEGPKSDPVSQGDFHGLPLESPDRPGLSAAPGEGEKGGGTAGGGGADLLSTPMGTAGRPARPAVRTYTAAASSAASTPRAGGRGGSPMARRTRPPPEGSALRSAPHSPHAPGLKTFGQAYMPFAAGFSGQAGEAPVYRSARLHAINPTAAVSEDTSYLWTLDSGLETPATRAANPHQPRAEHVRNTAAGTSGGLKSRLFQPIR